MEEILITDKLEGGIASWQFDGGRRPESRFDYAVSSPAAPGEVFWHSEVELGENDTNFYPNEDAINRLRIKYLEERVTPIFLALIKDEEPEYGRKGAGAKLFEQEFDNNAAATLFWFNNLYIRYFVSSEKMLLGLLRVIESLDEKIIGSVGQTMAIAALVHKNLEVQEVGVRIFENWASEMSLNILKSVHVESSWLQSYIQQVIKDIEDKLLCRY